MADKKVKLILTMETIGAKRVEEDVKDVQKTATTLQSELAKINRADAISQLATQYGLVAKKTKDATAAAQELSKELAKIKATEGEIAGAAGTFQQTASSGNRLARIGSELRALPSTQVPGLGIGTDQVASILRLAGALGQVSEKVGVVTTVATALTPALGATAAGLTAIAVAAAPFVIALGAIALALKALSDQAAEEAGVINAIVDAQRAVGQDIAGGLTSEDALKKLEELNRLREDEAARVANLRQSYQDNIESQGALSGVLKVASGAEDALASQIEKGTGLVTEYDTQIAALTKATEDGSLAANDAAEAEKKLTEERSKSALTAADAAGKELQAQQKALNATEQQNQDRLKAIENERAVAQKQIDSLTASGVTSEEVAAKIEALNTQLGALGNESEFIKNTALEQSRIRDAEKKAQKDAEDAAKKAQAAQEQYTKAVASATAAYRNSVQDIGTRLKQTLADNTTKLNRDLLSLDTKAAREEYDLTLKANREERNALLSQTDDLADIRRDAAKDEAQALQEGDFKALFLARQKGAETIAQEQDDAKKQSLIRQLNAADDREDLARSLKRQREDRLTNYRYTEADAFTAQRRELQQAALTRQRALQVASEGQNAELKMLGNYWQARLKLEQQGLNQSLQQASGSGITRTGISMKGIGINPIGAIEKVIG